MCCSTPSSSHSFQVATKMSDSVKDAPRSTRSLSMKDIGEETPGSSLAAINTAVEDGIGRGEGSQTVSSGEPSMGRGRNCTPSATGKHMLHMVNNDVLEGDTEDKPTMMDDTVSQEDKDTDRETGGMETSRRQPGVGEQVQQGGSGARCSYTAGGICNLHGPGAKLRWKPIVGEYIPGVRSEKKRHYFYVCMSKPGGTPRERGLQQTTLSFVRVAEDSRNTGVIQTQGHTFVQTRKEGQ